MIFISDLEPEFKKPNIFFYDNKKLINEGFYGMHSRITITAWDKTFYYLKNNNTYDYFWIIEDDCYLNKDRFCEFNNFSNNVSDAILFGWHKQYPDSWAHWGKNNNYFDKKKLCASINQIVRLSSVLLNKILESRDEINRFLFHELLIPSLIKKFNLKKTIVVNKHIHVCAMKVNSLIHKKYGNIDKKIILDDLNQNYIIVHPFKLWYD
jgi:hypothetical protein